MYFATDHEFLRSIRRHFVSLSGTFVRLDGQGNPTGSELPYCYSGFIIEIRGRLCFVTAGHVFQQIDNAIAERRLQMLRCGLADYFSQEAIVREPVHFDYEGTHRIVVDNDEVMDIGLMPLRDYYCNHVRTNGVRPVPAAQWQGRTPPRFESYALLGLPNEEMDQVERMGPRGPQIGFHATLTLVGIEALTRPPSEHIRSPIPRFAGLLCDGNALESVEGMSGGPILGISKREGGGWDYACVAVQGSWLRRERLLFGTPLSMVVEAIIGLLPR